MGDLDDTIREIVRDEIKKALAETAPSDYLSPRSAAALAEVTTRTIRQWIADGKIAGHGTGRLVRVRRADLERLLREGGRRRCVDDMSPEARADRVFEAMRARRKFG